MTNFNFQPTLTDGVFQIRPLVEADREGLFAAANDPKIWAGHPATDRYLRPVFDPYFNSLLGTNKTVVFEDVAQHKIIGCSQFYIAPSPPFAISIGYTFLSRAYWGGPTNLAIKTLMIGHIFETHDETWFHIAPTNIRSQKATAKLGAVFIQDETADLGSGSMPWKSYRLTKVDWLNRLAQSK